MSNAYFKIETSKNKHVSSYTLRTGERGSLKKRTERCSWSRNDLNIYFQLELVGYEDEEAGNLCFYPWVVYFWKSVWYNIYK